MKFAKIVSLAVFIFIVAVALMTFLDSYEDDSLESIGMIVFFILVAFGVGLCIWSIMKVSKYDLIDKEYYELSYGVGGLVEKEEKLYQARHRNLIIIGVVLEIVSLIPIFIAEYIYKQNVEDFIMNRMITIMLLFIAFGIGFITYTYIRNGSYRKILENEDKFVLDNKKKLEKFLLYIGCL